MGEDLLEISRPQKSVTHRWRVRGFSASSTSGWFGEAGLIKPMPLHLR